MRCTLAQTLDIASRFPVVAATDFVRRSLVVIAPHPDDESLGCGGLIAACRQAGIAVIIVVVSDGAGSHPDSPTYPPPRLAELRRREVIAAAAQLGVREEAVHCLNLPDCHVPQDGPEAEIAVARIAELSADADVMVVSWRHDPHCDHLASYHLACAAARRCMALALWEYPVWGLTLPADTLLDDGKVTGVRIPVRDLLPAKRAAIAAHASQVNDLIIDDPNGFRLTAQMLARFDGRFETYFGPAQ